MEDHGKKKSELEDNNRQGAKRLPVLYADDSRLQTGKRNDIATCLIQIVVHYTTMVLP